jgi:hypothetical protein
MAFKELHVSRVLFLELKTIVILPQTASSSGPGHVLSRGIPKVYSSTLKLLLQPFNVGFTVFFCPLLGVSTRKGCCWFRLGEIESSFKEFLDSPSSHGCVSKF